MVLSMELSLIHILQARKQWLYHVYDNHGNLLRQNLLDYDISREQLQSRYETLVDNLLPVLGGTTDMDIPYDSDGGATLSRKLAHYVFGNVEYSCLLYTSRCV